MNQNVKKKIELMLERRIKIMLLSKIIKMSTCILCLGTIVSGYVMATENNNDFPECAEQNNYTSSTIYQDDTETETENVGNEDADFIDITECNRLISKYKLNKEQSDKAIEAFKSKIEEGESEIYAFEYAKVMVVDEETSDIIGDDIADVYEKKIKEGKDEAYASIYAEFQVRVCMGEKKTDRIAKAYEQKIKEGKTECYAMGYAYFKLWKWDDKQAEEGAILYERNSKVKPIQIDHYAYEYANLKIVHNFDDEQAKRGAELYEEATGNGEGEGLSHLFVMVQMIDGFNMQQAYDYISEYNSMLGRTRDKDFARKYALLKAFNNFDDKQTRESLAIYEGKVRKGKSEDYAIRYAALKVLDELSDRKIEEISTIYEQKMKESRDATYANKYAMLKVVDKRNDKQADVGARAYEEVCEDSLETVADEYVELKILMEEGKIRRLNKKEMDVYLELFTQILNSGRSKAYASEYVISKIKNYDDSRARFIAKMYAQEMLKPGANDVFVREYMNLVLNCNVVEVFARDLAEIFAKNIGKGEEYAREYARMMVYYHATEEEAEKMTKIYLENVRAGKSRCYATEYARLVVKSHFDVGPEKIVKMTKMFEKEMIRGKLSEEAAREYAKLVVIDNKSRLAASFSVSVGQHSTPFTNRGIFVPVKREFYFSTTNQPESKKKK